MTGARRHIDKLWLMGLLLVLLTACSSSNDEEQDFENLVLKFYVYSPERPMITRGAADDVSPLAGENDIHSLQIWVFEHDANRLVGYLKPDTYPTAGQGVEYQMPASKWFSQADVKPNVDVYVVANAAAAGLSSLNESSTRNDLENAKIGSEYFGVGAPVSTFLQGLPMSGVLRDKSITGTRPIFTVRDGDAMARVRLLRAVSKVRFVFCRKPSGDPVSITNITIDGNMIPKEEYIFLTDKSYHIGNEYEPSSATLMTTATGDIKHCDDPLDYAYNNQTSQEYETLIDKGVSKNKLTQVGPFYFKETDKYVSGKISFKVGNSPTYTTPFCMSVADINKRFIRNHSWIVYAYYDLHELIVLTCEVLPWDEVQTTDIDVGL